MKCTFAVAMLLATTEAVKLGKHHKHHHKHHKPQHYEPEWGHNSGSSYNNGPTDHFYHGKASPYAVNGDDGLDVQTESKVNYEPGWGHNSGNSYNNGPFTHFYYGKASPYNVNGDNGLDVQTESKVNYEPG